MADIVCSEVLFTVQNNFGKVPVNNLVSVISEFYDESEIVSAKILSALMAYIGLMCR